MFCEFACVAWYFTKVPENYHVKLLNLDIDGILGISNKNMRKIIVASKTQTTQYQIEGELIQFAPAAIYAYWVSDYLFII